MRSKYLFFILTALAALTLSACQGNNEGDNGISRLEAKKDVLREKQVELKTIQDAIAEIEREIEAMENGYSRSDAVLVELDTLRPRDLNHYSVFQGNLQTRNQVMASAEVSGRIIEIKANEGDRVRNGQVLARLDTEVIDRQLAEVETTLRLARDVYERQKRLWDQNIGSEVQFLEAQNSVERLEKNMEVLEVQRSRAVVKAPKTGVLEQLMLRTGELVAPGTPVAVIVDMDNLKLTVNVPENYLAFIDRGKEVEVYIPSLDKSIDSRISRVGSTIDPENRTFAVEVNLLSDHPKLKPNLMARMSINDRTASGAIVIPLNVLQNELGGKAFVYVATKNANAWLAEKRYVKTGLSYRGEIEVTEGLQDGDILIVRGQQNVSEGQHLELLN
jgi:membrane fusion protein, multidrug efflux system